MKCECCGEVEAECIDFRSYGKGDDYLQKFRVCGKCLNRSDRSFWAKRNARLRKEV